MARYNKSICPPGVFCMSNSFTIIIITILIASVAIIAFINIKSHNPTIIVPPQRAEKNNTVIVPTGDSRFNRAPQPLRDWMAPPEYPPRGGLTSLPINIPTQGLPETFQSVGLITVDGSVWPLYGRRTATSNDRWNYYTRTDTYNPVPVPIRYQKRDCMDTIGCNEIMSGDNIIIDALHKNGEAKMYKFDGPKYIPGLL
jgi:hypothetical protein